MLYFTLYEVCSFNLKVDMTIPFCALQNELKAKWEVEKAMLEGSKNDAEKKYNEINEQVSSLCCNILIYLTLFKLITSNFFLPFLCTIFKYFQFHYIYMSKKWN
jgi:hypothetical protein